MTCAVAGRDGVCPSESALLIAYIIRRLLQLIVVLFGVTLITFGMLKLVPGDPAVALAGKGAIAREDRLRAPRARPRPAVLRAVRQVRRAPRCTATSASRCTPARPVAEMIREAAPVTIQLAVAAVLIELLGHPARACTRRYASTRSGTRRSPPAALILWGIPVFVLGYFAMYIFGLKLDWLPIGGVGPTVLGIIPSTWESWQTLILPGAHARPHRGRLHLVHAARLDARGAAARTSSAPRAPRASASARSSGATASRTPSSPS